MGRYVLPRISGLVLTEEDKANLLLGERNKDMKGPCTCGEPEAGRCMLCGGPACASGMSDMSGKPFEPGEEGLCCLCLDEVAC